MRFNIEERRVLLGMRRISEVVISRIEYAGIGSLEQLKARGIDALIERICRGLGNTAWRNRRRALAAAIGKL